MSGVSKNNRTSGDLFANNFVYFGIEFSENTMHWTEIYLKIINQEYNQTEEMTPSQVGLIIITCRKMI